MMESIAEICQHCSAGTKAARILNIVATRVVLCYVFLFVFSTLCVFIVLLQEVTKVTNRTVQKRNFGPHSANKQEIVA
jgi:hypothetical protein